jgi:glycerol-3-phosphate dehydrogenase
MGQGPMSRSPRVAVIGAGSWGTTVALLTAANAGLDPHGLPALRDLPMTCGIWSRQ